MNNKMDIVSMDMDLAMDNTLITMLLTQSQH